ncbi:MAG: VWA domain-containing protein [Myxococcales bacterium]|nr:VWA domain-containing protein [Myxococcales bacterium]
MFAQRFVCGALLIMVAACQKQPAVGEARPAPTPVAAAAAAPAPGGDQANAQATEERRPVVAESAAQAPSAVQVPTGGAAVAAPAPAAQPQPDREGATAADDDWSPEKAFAGADKPQSAAAATDDVDNNKGKNGGRAGDSGGGPQVRSAPADEPAEPDSEKQPAQAMKPEMPKPMAKHNAADRDEKSPALARSKKEAASGGDKMPEKSKSTAGAPPHEELEMRDSTAEVSEPKMIRKIGSGSGGAIVRTEDSGIGALYVPQRSSDKIFRWLPRAPSFYPRDARYRSNYLPGRGYLDHLAAQIQSGKALGVEGGLVAASPRRSLAPPTAGQSLRVAVDLSEGEVPLTGGRTVLRVRLRAAEQGLRERGPLRLHLVLDSSGSMKGKPWQQVCAAVRDLATRLGPADQLSVVHYGSEAFVLSAPVAGGPGLMRIADQVCKLKPRAETNTFAGLQLGYQQARSAYTPNASNRVLLLSDGMPTVGPNDPYGLTVETARALGQGIVTSAIGVGNDFDALLMDRVALEGGGNHHFVRDSAALPAVLTDELEVLTKQAAEAVDVRIRLPGDVGLVEVVGSEPLSNAEALRVRQVEVAADQRIARENRIPANRARDYDGGVRFLLPSFRAGDEHSFLLVIEVPPGSERREVARVEVRYKDTVAKRNGQFVGGRSIDYAPTRSAAPQGEPEVKLALGRTRAGLALQRASEYLDINNLPRIRSELYAAARELQRAADSIGSAAGHREATRVQALADAAGMALQNGQRAWLTSVFHYSWRMCGETAWGG